ncbi:hypothetical protein K450DRAFT_221297 [Umbelopsis ramanniana AG]|uniref:BTB domain-containing protein n=1 Tax=Umbelopsis ramanniana AG TaxID=1314678 RepID=A0AAD5EIW5_UMBRA|nr:uncharacterized protein K450DRAFT_221297 [Umbelopsis ramanniana AG]KAI8584059.1 hypothetical protein K450DRAFT_221297 [Umbelopsis ramanniana AG]
MAARASLSSIETLVSELSLSRPDSSSSSNDAMDTSPPPTPSSRRRTESNPPMLPLMPSAATTTRRLISNASVDAPLERTHKITDTASSSTTPDSSANTPATGSSVTGYDWHQQSLNLCMHIFSRGFIDGVGSDVTVSVPAWKKHYKLHRLILDQNPYFSTLLNGNFREASSGIVTLHFDESNAYITADSFEFVLARLYGKMNDPDINHSNVRHILATCSYLQLEQLCDHCYHFITSDLQENNVVDYLIFADQYALHGSSRILEAVLTFLCREAWNMDRLSIAQMPVDWLQKLIESDAFWVPSEFDRYRFAIQVISEQRRLYSQQQQEKTRSWAPSRENLEHSISSMSYSRSRRQSGLSDKSASEMHSKGMSPAAIDYLNEEHEAVYEDIFSNSIFYTHMNFDQLEKIRKDRDEITGQRYVPDHVLKDALWQQIELRSRIESANERDTDLGVTSSSHHETMDDHTKVRYAIPSDDTTNSTGESALSQAIGQKSMSSSLKPMPNPSTFSIATNPTETFAKSYSKYPPFRFSVEFNDVAQLKPNVKVYSKNVFYAGSNWNMYIQKHKSQRKGPLLGIYLHRQSIPLTTGFGGHTGAAVGEQGGNAEHARVRSDSSSANSAGYSDRRKCVRTWFKIFCPARGPKQALTLFQSCPDEFKVSQSWGWKSTSLYSDRPSTVDDHQGVSPDAEMTRNAPGMQTPTALRFSVVMGHV